MNDKVLLDAVRQGDLRAVKKQISLGAKCTIPYYAMIEAIRHNQLKVVQFLVNQNLALSSDRDFYPLIEAAKYGHLRIVRYMIQHTHISRTTLHEAFQHSVQYGHLRIVKYLVSQGCDSRKPATGRYTNPPPNPIT
jgi:hypothetical protein